MLEHVLATILRVTLNDPYRFSDWMAARQERIPFLRDVLFTMRQQFPDTELIFSLETTDDDVVIVEPSGMEPYRFRVSEYLAIQETVQPYHSNAGYRDFLRRYRNWHNRFQAWWHGYRSFLGDEQSRHQSVRTEVRSDERDSQAPIACGGGD